MSLRDINHQAAIELGELDTEYVAALKQEREQLQQELRSLRSRPNTMGRRIAITRVRECLARIEELLAK